MKLLTPLPFPTSFVDLLFFPHFMCTFVFSRLGETSFNKYDLNFILSRVSSVHFLRSVECEVVKEDQ